MSRPDDFPYSRHPHPGDRGHAIDIPVLPGTRGELGRILERLAVGDERLADALASEFMDAANAQPEVTWEQLSKRALVTGRPIAGEWTLIYLAKRPLPHQPDNGPGWYLYGPDVTALHLGAGSTAEAMADAGLQVRAYAAVRRAQASGTGPIVPDHIRAAIHAGHVGQVGIYCDRCGVTHKGDYTGETREDRFAAARRHLELRKGWLCSDGEDVCPVCRTNPVPAAEVEGA